MLDAMLERITGGARHDGWRRWAWLAFFGLAPAAFLWGLTLHWQNAKRRAETFADPARMLEQAQAVAAAEGINITGWKSVQQVVVSDPLQQFQRRNEIWAQLPAAQRRLVPRTWIRVILHSAAMDQWLAVWLRPDASVFAFDTSTGLVKSRANISEAEARQLAQRRFSSTCAGDVLDMGDPEIQNATAANGLAVRRFVWRGNLPGLADLKSVCGVEIVGDRVKSVNSDFNWSASVGTSSIGAQFFSQARALILLTLILYAIYRFSRRALEREVPWSRCVTIFVFLVCFALFLQLINSDYAAGSLPVDRALSAFRWVIAASVLLNFALQGMMLGLSYGASEGELRETYPGKLTAWDALLTGRIWSRNVGVAVLFGAAAGAWAIFFRAGIWESLHLERVLNETQLLFTFGPLPWVMQMISEPITALFLVTFAALLPVMFANRWVASRWLRRLMVVLLALIGATVSTVVDINAPADLVAIFITAGLVLAAFWFRDLLASVVAVVVYSTYGLIQDLSAMVPVWLQYSPYAMAIGAATLLAAFVMVFRAREVKDEDVRPVYAKRLLERLLMQTEVSAAREAQLRLLPEKLPEIPGLRIEASCLPAREVGGDFYDFFVLPRGRLGVLVAEGGSSGLASALTIGLAKGFLLYAARRDWTAPEALRRLAPLLQEATHQAIERLGLAYLTIDPAARLIHAARLGVHPRLFSLGGGTNAGELRLFEVVGAARLAESRATLAAGESLVIITDGIEKRLAAKKRGIEKWVSALDPRVSASASGIHGALLNEAGAQQGELDDDLTAIVIRFDLAPAMERVEVA